MKALLLRWKVHVDPLVVGHSFPFLSSFFLSLGFVSFALFTAHHGSSFQLSVNSGSESVRQSSHPARLTTHHLLTFVCRSLAQPSESGVCRSSRPLHSAVWSVHTQRVAVAWFVYCSGSAVSRLLMTVHAIHNLIASLLPFYFFNSIILFGWGRDVVESTTYTYTLVRAN
jgi:hypothetical protein